MAGPAVIPASEHADIQALLRAGFGDLTGATYLLLLVTQAASARAWLRGVAPTSIADLHAGRQARVLQVAFTAAGLRALDVPAAAIDGFSPPFREGMAEPNRARRLGDVGSDAPPAWQWGAGAAEPHVLLALFATPSDLPAFLAETRAAFAGGCAEIAALDTGDLDGREPFGFVDGISQPVVDWDGARGGFDTAAYTNLIAAGEFVLGYANEYGQLTDRPLLDAALPGAALLPVAAEDASRRDLGRNGSYLVVRQLAQDVAGFRGFLAAHAPTNPDALGAAMVGRRQDGTPLLPPVHGAIPGVGPERDDMRLNQFTFADDPDGLACPFGAHIRRANPRTGDLPPGRDGPLARLVTLLGFDRPARPERVASARFHRLLRRGREYGGEGAECGLHFLALGANIARQFEFVQNAWIAGTGFDGLPCEADPLLGNRAPLLSGAPTDRYSIPRPGEAPSLLTGLPRFVTVRGGAYFFLPGLRALKFIAG